MLQEEEYRLRQQLELGTDKERQPLQSQEEEEGPMSSDSPEGQHDLTGRGGSLGTGYFDQAGNWQTYDTDPAMGTEVQQATNDAPSKQAAEQAPAARSALLCSKVSILWHAGQSQHHDRQPDSDTIVGTEAEEAIKSVQAAEEASAGKVRPLCRASQAELSTLNLQLGLPVMAGIVAATAGTAEWHATGVNSCLTLTELQSNSMDVCLGTALC